LLNILLDNPMTQFSFEWILSLNWLCQKWGQVQISVVHPDWLQPHQRALVSFAELVQEKEVRWHMAQMLPRLKLSAARRRAVIALLFKYLDDGSAIVKTFSMQALFDMSESDAALRARVLPVIEAALETGSGAMRSRARKLLAQLV
jgi:hypothetical protein